MTSILKVDTIQDTAGNNIINESGDTITIGASGDTVNVVGTLQNNGSALASYTDTDVLDLFNASGSAPVYACRAWVNFDGTGTPAINASGNVSSITDNGVGAYTVNFTTAMPDANYVVTACGTDTQVGSSPFVRALHVVAGTRGTSSVQVTLQYAGADDAGYFDYAENDIAILG
jgi:hypothetical protein